MFKVNTSRIRTLMFERGIGSILELARQAKINPTTAAKVLKDGAAVTAKPIGALANFFGVDGNELILRSEENEF